ncbi:hypothetical protein DCAR_0415747 [Daucus carota subsp. sativus]|uniref:RIN4 pathogenic type III effector avirulence factor Avr cleavage site domain-containing protein n=1 Tax=Daucus carota subsp. sativus TaxID=79200 RepID=A0AAF0WUN4_DAUCS|nr:hypothetical protein DCAR_0415747 [Daucus carota subsp. sativus]
MASSTFVFVSSDSGAGVEFKKSHVPVFGSWDCNDDLPFTQCFESARQARLLRYSYSEDRDLYVTGDLCSTYKILVKGGYPLVKDSKKEGWVVCECEYEYEHDVKESPSPVPNAPPPRKAPKAVDEDLYNIFPDLLYANSKRVRGDLGFFSCCFRPSRDLCLHAKE